MAKRKRNILNYTQAQRDAMPTVYATCPTCKGWQMVTVDDPNGSTAERKLTASWIGNAVMRGCEINRTTAAQWRASKIPMCECGDKKVKKSTSTSVAQEALF